MQLRVTVRNIPDIYFCLHISFLADESNMKLKSVAYCLFNMGWNL